MPDPDVAAHRAHQRGEPDGCHPAAISDDRGGGRLGAEHLLSLGHRRLALISVAEPDRAARDRASVIGAGRRERSSAAPIPPVRIPTRLVARMSTGAPPPST